MTNANGFIPGPGHTYKIHADNTKTGDPTAALCGVKANIERRVTKVEKDVTCLTCQKQKGWDSWVKYKTIISTTADEPATQVTQVAQVEVVPAATEETSTPVVKLQRFMIALVGEDGEKFTFEIPLHPVSPAPELGFKTYQVNSTMLSSLSYAACVQTLRLKFRTGAEYDYEGVDQSTLDALLTAHSLGHYYFNNIKGKFTTIKRELVA